MLYLCATLSLMYSAITTPTMDDFVTPFKHTFTPGSATVTVNRLLSRSDLREFEEELLVDGTLTIGVDLTYATSEHTTVSWSSATITIPQPNISHRLAALSSNNQYTDMSFAFPEGTLLHAHRAIIATR